MTAHKYLIFLFISFTTLKLVVTYPDRIDIKLNFCESVRIEFLKIPAQFMKENVSQSFRATFQDVKCPKASKVQNMVSDANEQTFLFYSSGDIVLQPDTEYLLRSEFCIKRFSPQLLEIKTCKVVCGVTHTCVHKCCPPHQIIDFSQGLEPPCKSLQGESWKPVFYRNHKGCGIRVEANDVKYHLLSVSNMIIFDHFPYKHISFNHFEEGIMYTEGLRFRLMRDGHLMSQQLAGKWEPIHHGEFCIDGMTGYIGSGNYSHSVSDQVFWSIQKSESELNVSSDDNAYNDHGYESNSDHTDVVEQLVLYFYFPLMIAGATFLLLTSLLYILIWEKHNIHGWTIFAYVTTMFFMFIFLVSTKKISVSMTMEFGRTPACKSIGVLAHFFYLSTMCWLSVINIDLWLTFRNVKPVGTGKSQSVRRFAFYTLFGLGVPVLIVAFAVVIDSFYMGSFGDGTECESPFYLPLYGLQQCYLHSGAQLYYLYIPMAIVLSFNILTFSSTVFSLYMYRNQSRNATSNGSNQKESLILFGKLFIVTGISWVLELIQFFFPEEDRFWMVVGIVFDAYNLLQAFLIFIIFALKRENLLFLYQTYPRARFLLNPVMRTPCCYAESFDPEQTEMTNVHFDQRHSRIRIRRGSNNSTTSGKVAYK